ARRASSVAQSRRPSLGVPCTPSLGGSRRGVSPLQRVRIGLLEQLAPRVELVLRDVPGVFRSLAPPLFRPFRLAPSVDRAATPSVPTRRRRRPASSARPTRRGPNDVGRRFRTAPRAPSRATGPADRPQRSRCDR